MIVLLTKQHWVDQIKDNEMVAACSTQGKQERYLQGFGREM